MGGIFQREPARIAGAITNFLTVMILLFAAFGMEISEDQRNAILASIVPTITMIQLMFEMVRGQVVPVQKAAPLIQTALQAAPEVTTPEFRTALQNYDLKGARQIAATVEQGANVVPDTQIEDPSILGHPRVF